MRAFDLLNTAENDIRHASQPRYYFEMALLRWMHLRKLVPLTELMEQMAGGGTPRPSPPGPPMLPPRGVAPRTVTPGAATSRASSVPLSQSRTAAAGVITPGAVAPSQPRTAAPGTVAPPHPRTPAPSAETPASGQLKDAFLAEVRAGKAFFYNTVVAQAQRIDVAADAITFAFLPNHRALREQFDTTRAWLEAIAEKVAGRRVTVTAVQAAAPSNEPVAAPAAPEKPSTARDLRAEALSSSAVQAMLEVFPAEISDVEEM
jgi:DNA polymerase III gamma/tau subunit